MLSLPFGFLTTAILYANEIPDLQDDVKAGKFTWASVTSAKKAYLAYCVLIAFAFLSVILNVGCRFIDPAALISLLLIFIAAKAAAILKNYPDDKKRLVISSQLTIAVHLLVSLILIGSVIV
jgi:1,4-dihydroxy-2-naphthoate octaprenyltransferase